MKKEKLEEIVKHQNEIIDQLKKEKEDLQERIDKAIEYIQRSEVSSIGTPFSYTERGKDLLEILKGSDK